MGDSVPLAYFITFRTYGTWLHGDERGAVDRFHNYYGTPLIPPDQDWRARNERVLSHEPVTLSESQRNCVDAAIRQTCEVRTWLLRALNVRTNHVHVVLSSESNRPDRILKCAKGECYEPAQEVSRVVANVQPVVGGRKQEIRVDRSGIGTRDRLRSEWPGWSPAQTRLNRRR
jgi:hypothetical protein